jgi:hypothetical protein
MSLVHIGADVVESLRRVICLNLQRPAGDLDLSAVGDGLTHGLFLLRCV